MASENYFQKTKNILPRKTLVKALEFSEQHPPSQKIAFDLGCGNGRDTYALLNAGWKVKAFDKSQDAISALEPHPDLEKSCCRFESIPWQPAPLVNASFTLPFCPASIFPQVWQGIGHTLANEGIFAGHFFGLEDGWERLIRFSKTELGILFEGFQFLHFEEQKYRAATISGKEKDWHVFEIVALKK